MAKTYILDCTLRDGGYVNNWNFGNKGIHNIISDLGEAKIDIIECGILGLIDNNGDFSKFGNFKEMEEFLPEKRGALYACMLNYSEKDKFLIPERNSKTVDCIRVAFFKPEAYDALKYAEGLKEKGYLVFLQAMVTSQYSDEELSRLIEAVNALAPFAFSLVDSFGTMYNAEVTSLYYKIDKGLDKPILFGFHAHNNLQMAFSNAIAFIETNNNKRNIIVDATVHGMGRGAGNACTELVAKYLNEKYHGNYNVDKILYIFENELKNIYEEFYWGYTNAYFATARLDINSAYIWYLSQRGINNYSKIDLILRRIPQESKYFLNKPVIDEILKNL